MLRRLLFLALSIAFCASLLSAQGRGPGAGQPRMPGIGGTISAIDGQTITLKSFQGETAKVRISGSTEFRRGQQPMKFSELKVGDTIFVMGERKDGVWMARVVRQPDMTAIRQMLGKRFIMGEIKKIDETRLTILRPDSETQIIEVDENTSFRNQQRESITLADFKVGDQVFGRGELKKGTFVPRVLNLGNPGMGFGMGPGMRPGPPAGNRGKPGPRNNQQPPGPTDDEGY